MKAKSLKNHRIKGTLVISKLHKYLSGLSHSGETYLIYVPKKVPFASEIFRHQLVRSK